MIPLGPLPQAVPAFKVEVRKAIAICADCQTAVHVGQTAKVGGSRVVHEKCIHPSERGAQVDTADVSEVGGLIWRTSRADESTISATGANIVARAILASDWLADRERKAAERAWEQGASFVASSPTGLDRKTWDNPYRADRSAS